MTTLTASPTKALERIRPDVRAMHAYVVQSSVGYLKMDAMENPFSLPASLQQELGQRLGALALNRYPGERMNDLKAALATYAGFQAVPETLRMAGRNYGLRGLSYVLQILVPAALPSILSGLKIGWAFAWRTLIAAELVFGASSGKGGLGWYIFQSRNELYTDQVFAGLALVIIIGLLVETLGFHQLERVTVKRWGVQR